MWEWKVYNNSHVFIALGTLFLGFVWAYDWLSGLILTFTSIFVYYYFRRYFTERERQFFWYRHFVSKSIDQAQEIMLQTLRSGIAIIDEIGRFDWANEKFSEIVNAKPKAGELIVDYWPDFPFDLLWTEHVKVVQLGDKSYRLTAKPYMSSGDSHPQMIVFIEDISEVIAIAKAYENIMPFMMAIQIDNLADVIQGLTENQSSLLLAQVTQRLNDWVQGFGGYIKKISVDSYTAVSNRAALASIIEGKFVVLDEVRDVRAGNKIPVTLSIGAAVGEKCLADLSQIANANLDLALGRGGDQAVLNVDGKTSFYGGKAKPVEKNTRVKVRVTASALKKVMREASNIYIMGHKNEDYDCIGAAFGVWRMAKGAGKKALIVSGNPSKELSQVAAMLHEYEDYEDIIFDKAASAEVEPEDLLIVVDTHRPVLLSDRDFAERFSKIVVIDHHRRAEDFIESPLLSYFEPSSSSASEMVVELIHYFGDNLENKLTHLEASLLMAGIMLDTKNFSIQAGARTFEAAAELRRAGSDIALIKKLFVFDLERFKLRAQIGASVEQIGAGALVAVCPPGIEDGKVLAAQIADGLLVVDEVSSSFVLFPEEGAINVSARSNGTINVQVIMEKFGGGGHHTVAGAQIANMTVDEIKAKIREYLYEYLGKETKNESDIASRS